MHFAAECSERDDKTEWTRKRIRVREVFNFDRIFVSAFIFTVATHIPRRRAGYTKHQKAHPRALSTWTVTILSGRCKPCDGARKEGSLAKVRTDLREILLPFFRQCICGGGAPSAVQ